MSELFYSDMVQFSGFKIWSKRSVFHAPDFIKDSVDFA